MSKVGYFLILLLVLVSCRTRNVTTDPVYENQTERHKSSSDVEIIDYISLDGSDSVFCDSMVTSGMPFVNRWPERYECYDGHFVIFIDSLSPRVAELTLLSLSDWDNVMSSYSETPDNASKTASLYDEFGLSGWEIPTESQARLMTESLDIDEMNQELSAMYGDEIQVTKGSSNVRYLCEKAEKTFSFAENTKITKAGAKTKYRLRLVQTIRVARI